MKWWLVGLGLVIASWGWPIDRALRAEAAAVRAVLFYSPTCPHCHKVITEDLIPLLESYNGRLQILGVDTSTLDGQALYQAAVQRYSISEERLGVPTLVIGETVLVGSVEIPEQLPGLIEAFLAEGGVDWPAIPGLAEAMAAAQPPPTPTLAASPTTTEGPGPTSALSALATPAAPTARPEPTAADALPGLITAAAPAEAVLERLARDPAGNTLALVVLAGMVVTAGYLLAQRRLPVRGAREAWRESVIVGLGLLGLGVAGYLAYVETAQVTAVCGPIGDCNTVQQSAYARLFGLIPIGVLGVVGYLALLALSLVMAANQRGRLADLAGLARFGLAAGGTLFSIYLTFLEPFVIGATCAWCLTSAIIMTALLWLTAGPAGPPRLVARTQP